MDVSVEKKELRRLALARRDAMTAERRADASLALCRALDALPELCGAKTVFGYAAVGSECDLGALYEALARRGAVLDAVLVPCAAFDGDGNRLGRGGGYYDRYLARCPQAAAILTAFEAQRLPRVPREAHDLRFSLLVTEAGVFRK